MSERELTIKEVLHFIINQKQGYSATFTTWDMGIAQCVQIELAKRIAKEFNVKYSEGTIVLN
jgi:hypothetical protein